MPGYNQSTNRYTLAGTSYDARGNLLNDTFHTYTWNVYGKLATVDGTTTLTNDANDRVVEKSVSGVFSEIEYSLLGKACVMNGRTQTRCYVPLPGGEVFSPGPDTFWHMDWLGTVRLASSAPNRTITFDRAFAPFGETYNTVTGGTSNPEFAGLTQDTISGEYDTDAREYHPTQGRWISPDPLGMQAGDPSNPQSWNLYAYVINNPLVASDPDGLDCVYLNDTGTGVEAGGIDQNSDVNECASHHGYWIPGTVVPSSLMFDPDNDTIGAISNVNGFLEFTASYNGQFGNQQQSVGLGTADTPVDAFVFTAPDDLSPRARAIFQLAYLETAHDLGCAGLGFAAGDAGAAFFKAGQPVAGIKRFRTPGTTVGPSPISQALRETFPQRVPGGIQIPTPVGGPGTGTPFRIARTASVGAAIGRYAPFVGVATTAYGLYKLNSCLNTKP